MWKRIRFLLLTLHFSFSPIFKYKQISSFISQGLRVTESWNLVYTWTVGWCIMYTWIRLLVFIYSFISSIFFLSSSENIKFFVTLFCQAYKVETWCTHGQMVDLLCTPNTSSQNILVPLFFFLFLSLQLAKIKNLHLQNCFNLPLMATAVEYVSFAHSLLPPVYLFAFIRKWRKGTGRQ